MKKRPLFIVTAVLTGFILAFQPACGDDSGGSDDDTETGSADLTGDTGSSAVSSDADTGGDAADTVPKEGNGACSCMTQAACTAGVNEVDYSYVCSELGNVCCKNAAGTTDSSSGADTSTQIGDTSAGNNDSDAPVDTAVNWWDDTDSSDDSDDPADTGSNWWDDSDEQNDTGTDWWGNDSDDTNPVDTSDDSEMSGSCPSPYSCVTRQECWRNGERMDDFECAEGVCCDLGDTLDTEDVTDTEDGVDTEESVECQFDCVNRWQCDGPGEYEVESQECDGNEICCATDISTDDSEEDTGEPVDSETIEPTSECDAQGFYCISETQCTVAQAREEFECDVAGTVCCEL